MGKLKILLVVVMLGAACAQGTVDVAGDGGALSADQWPAVVAGVVAPDNGQQLPDDAAGDDAKTAVDAAMGSAGWAFRVPVALDTSRVKATLKGHQLRLTLSPTSFNYAHASAGGADLRFASKASPGASFDLPFWIQTWNPKGGSTVWVKLPTLLPGKAPTVYLFYGRARRQGRKGRIRPRRHAGTGRGPGRDLRLHGERTGLSGRFSVNSRWRRGWRRSIAVCAGPGGLRCHQPGRQFRRGRAGVRRRRRRRGAADPGI